MRAHHLIVEIKRIRLYREFDLYKEDNVDKIHIHSKLYL